MFPMAQASHQVVAGLLTTIIIIIASTVCLTSSKVGAVFVTVLVAQTARPVVHLTAGTPSQVTLPFLSINLLTT